MTIDEACFAELGSKIRHLSDRQQILDCVVGASRGHDRFDRDLIAGAYLSDGQYELGQMNISRQDCGHHTIHAHAAIGEANLHNVTMHGSKIDGDVTRAESYAIGLFADNGAAPSRMHNGSYIDRLEKGDGKWGIVLGRATGEIALESEALLPNGKSVVGSGCLKGSRDRTDPAYQRPLPLLVAKGGNVQ